MKSLIRNSFVLFLALIAGMVWLEAQAAKPVKVTVTSAIPDNAEQGEYVDVEIDGTGFDNGSKARFLVTDTKDATQIDVLQTTFVGPEKLKAKIKVKDAALVIDYDVEVTTSSGRRGKGTTLFRVRERAGEYDPCLTSTSPFPEFMFFRELTAANNSNWGIFLASEDGACTRQLIEIQDSSLSYISELSFSYNPGDSRGYVTWIKAGTYENPIEDSIWLLEFWVQGNTITAQSEPELIVMLPDNDETRAEAWIADLDVSKNLQRLVFTYWNFVPEDWGEVHIVNIEGCRFPSPPCAPGAESLAHDGSAAHGWGKIAWGPLGNRVYLTENEDAADPADGIRRIRMVTHVDGAWIDDGVLLSSYDYPEYMGIWRSSSGTLGDREKLAFRHDGDCRTISVIDVADCEAGLTCEAEFQFYGATPGWTDRGTIVHKPIERGRYLKNRKRYDCTTSDFIGEWDPNRSDVTPLVEGQDPDTG